MERAERLQLAVIAGCLTVAVLAAFLALIVVVGWSDIQVIWHRLFG